VLMIEYGILGLCIISGVPIFVHLATLYDDRPPKGFLHTLSWSSVILGLIAATVLFILLIALYAMPIGITIAAIAFIVWTILLAGFTVVAMSNRR